MEILNEDREFTGDDTEKVLDFLFIILWFNVPVNNFSVTEPPLYGY